MRKPWILGARRLTPPPMGIKMTCMIYFTLHTVFTISLLTHTLGAP
jgi:hypothetical protein